MILLMLLLDKEAEHSLILNVRLAQKIYEINLLKGYGTDTYKSTYFRVPLVHWRGTQDGLQAWCSLICSAESKNYYGGRIKSKCSLRQL